MDTRYWRRGEVMSEVFAIRPARRPDAADMAILDDIAGAGLPSLLWRKEVESGRTDNALSFARDQMMRRDTLNCWLNCRIAQCGDAVAGLATSYPLTSVIREETDIAPLAPVLTLMSMARGSWYVDALAVYPEQRRRHIGSRLIEDVFERAKCEGNATEVSLILRSDNEAGARFYERFGFAQVIRKPIIGWEGSRALGREYFLMSAPV
jgi:ribosomal protein S18 acetylase RimI-like enzyme